MAAGKIRVGISGRRYKGWRGKFYPEKLRQKDEWPYVAETFPTVEINGTFYSIAKGGKFSPLARGNAQCFRFFQQKVSPLYNASPAVARTASSSC